MSNHEYVVIFIIVTWLIAIQVVIVSNRVLSLSLLCSIHLKFKV